jgi:hypothetical protein
VGGRSAGGSGSTSTITASAKKTEQSPKTIRKKQKVKNFKISRKSHSQGTGWIKKKSSWRVRAAVKYRVVLFKNEWNTVQYRM